ncbi:hypothetical protein BDK51DRAFT_38344 [Blyttiomyces helicus]|uniref:F-box domain-containing protein n=1 Tax=Blyttiomyces helicus TaxID=388810 RepID=A0A4P9W4Z2_9FUNG|nr:hypothetical protein BDK51DRAFT_38344 [Blyttiomyces helicus]|eukprot:RKO87002.1 hypothetical protein BDK51DRAFT_38344 [Blyttiomyces helicus]
MARRDLPQFHTGILRQFRDLLLRSLGTPLVDMGLNVENARYAVAVPHFEANTLPNLKVVDVNGFGCSRFLLPSPLANRPPLRRVALGRELCESPRHLATLLRACPSITDLDISSARELSRAFLNIADNSITDDALLGCLACIARTSPLLEILRLGDRGTLHSPSLDDLAFIADLKRGCPRLRHVGLGVSPYCSKVAEHVLKFVQDLEVDIYAASFLVDGYSYDLF